MFTPTAPALLLGVLSTAHLIAANPPGPPDFSTFQYQFAPTIDFEPSYDFCIVGGGTAGLVLANRLTEIGKHNVIVFEGGPTPDTNPTSLTGGANPYLLNGARSLVDYNFVTQPQRNLNNRSLPYHRGRCLGGSSATNGFFYGLGSKAVYDQWELDGNPGWNWANISAAAKRGTMFVGNPNNTNDNTYMTWDPENYGTEGPLKVGFQGFVPASNPAFMNATSAIGVGVVHDQNGGSPIGIKQGTLSLDENFVRSSSWSAYYDAAKDRPNLNVRERSVVSTIIFNETDSGEQEATGLTFVEGAIWHNISCSKEVIVSAGAFHSPYILKQSGVGPRDELEEHEIPVLVENEHVGHHMQDHTAFSVIYSIKPEFAHIASTTEKNNDLTLLNEQQRAFYNTSDPHERAKSRWSAVSGTNAFQEICSEDLEQFGAGAVIDAGLVNQAHNEIMYEGGWYPFFSNKYGKPRRNTSYVSLTVSNMAALSQGSVTVGNNMPLGDPVIDPNYLNHTADIAMAIQGLKYVRKIGQHPDWQKWVAEEVAPGPGVQTDEEILEYVKTVMIPNWHAASTCRMLPKEKGGVVDSHLRVYGTKRLRVCDVSTLGRLPDINLQGSVYAVAEHGARMIREEYGDL
ncbi:unnamed protein product [Zymoseptoria tritici ST99CH_1E4]|uniref:Glucose-methanol-choline oxidoreductase N-terminal domain-containing protein n=1 Tax=Zymoseptoria tritici ST99CH_1E4 TaxID=1276532 RepID=A0A2H1FL65_ZYMTR|nr:unnamed protein product [Zymoseptoria tritici ST99CH_1E4]